MSRRTSRVLENDRCRKIELAGSNYSTPTLDCEEPLAITQWVHTLKAERGPDPVGSGENLSLSKSSPERK
jgi:hypothetical protein